MDTLKKLANRKVIVVAMIVEVLVLIYTIISNLNTTTMYGLVISYWNLVGNFISIAGIAIIVYSLLKNKKDVLLLIGVGLMVLKQIVDLLNYFTFYAFLYFVAWVAIGLLTIIVVIPEKIPALQEVKKYSNIIGIVSALIFVVSYILNVLVTFIRMSVGYWLFNISDLLIFVVSSVIILLILVSSYSLFAIYMGNLAQGEENPDVDFSKMSEDISKASDNIAKTASEITNGSMAMSLGLHVVLLLVTCGIWYYIWIYKSTDYLNQGTAEKRTPVNQLLLCMFIPFYVIYWVYKSAGIIDEMCKEKNISSDITTICLILAIFVNIVPPIIMQEKINALENMDGTDAATNTAPTGESQKSNTTSDIAEEIREYKKLLDEGLITEEEFEAKKKQIMGL